MKPRHHAYVAVSPNIKPRYYAYVAVLLFIFVIYWSRSRWAEKAEELNQQIPAKSLTEISWLFDTYKGPRERGHNYTPIYEHYFEPFRFKPIRLLEIGVFTGASVKMWECYFPAAELHFIDITAARMTYNMSSRSTLHIMNQSNQTALNEFAAKMGQFDVIIDDGGHRMDEQIKTFESLFKLVKPEGFYVIEDLHTSYWRAYGGKGEKGNPRTSSVTAIGYLKDLVDSVNFVGAYTGSAASGNLTETVRSKMDYFMLHIHSIHFYDSLSFILAK